MHKNKIMHRDIKLGNILLSQKNDFNDIKMIDYNFAAHWVHYLFDEEKWYVLYQDMGQDKISWDTFGEKNEKEARARYAELEGKGAKMLY